MPTACMGMFTTVGACGIGVRLSLIIPHPHCVVRLIYCLVMDKPDLSLILFSLPSSLQGFLRVFNDMTEIVLDAPNAYHTLSKFAEKGMESGFITQMIAEQVPNR